MSTTKIHEHMTLHFTFALPFCAIPPRRTVKTRINQHRSGRLRISILHPTTISSSHTPLINSGALLPRKGWTLRPFPLFFPISGFSSVSAPSYSQILIGFSQPPILFCHFAFHSDEENKDIISCFGVVFLAYFLSSIFVLLVHMWRGG